MYRLRRMYVSLVWCLLVIIGGNPFTGQAQTSVTQAPVRYDKDWPSPAFYASRRQAVREHLPPHAVAIFFSAPMRTRSRDVEFEYRQDSDLLYLSGMTEPGSVLIIFAEPTVVAGDTVREVLFVPPRDPRSEVWTGRRLGPEGAERLLGVEKALPNTEYASVLHTLAADTLRVFHLPLPEGVESGDVLYEQLRVFRDLFHPVEVAGGTADRRLLGLLMEVDDAETFRQVKAFLSMQVQEVADSSVQQLFQQFQTSETIDAWRARREAWLQQVPDGFSLRKWLNRLRMHKTEEELALMQRAIDITADAHRALMQTLQPGQYEYQAEALIEYVFKREGAEYPAFPSIVGSGENSVILHYNTNRRQMQAGDVVVVDIGAEYHGYAADITRTLPVSGTFSPEQRAIYELVLKAQEAGIAKARAGEAFRAPGDTARQVIAQGLMELGLIQSPDQVRRFFMHGTSHYVGLDVHDVGTYGLLQPGQVITVEPGIYIAPAPDIDPRWWNIGVRIEDDVLITEGDPVVLSRRVPRTVEAIEAMMARRRKETGSGK